MSTTTLVTADELLALPTGMGKRYELISGELRVMSPAGWRHGKVTARLTTLLGSFVADHDLGEVFGAETGFRLSRNPDTVRAPDFSYIAKGNLPEQEPSEAFWPGAPDLAVEVISHDDRPREVEEKARAWLAAGCQVVWNVDPKSKTIKVYAADDKVEVIGSGDLLKAESILPGFSCSVDELFK
jgi:Uma2 family endonuclease